MRIKVTLDVDVAAKIGQARRSRRISLKAIVNAALREHLAEAHTLQKSPPAMFRTRSHNAGRLMVALPDSVQETLALCEGDSYR
jgi:hypothetical protein